MTRTQRSPAAARPGLRRWRALAGCAAGAMLLGGCVSAADLPLPGGGTAGPSYPLNARFSNALNLPQAAHVKLNGVQVGTVERIALKDYQAEVTMSLRREVRLPLGTFAELRQATPLGDIFVALFPPPGGAQAAPPMQPGTTIPATSTRAAASVEDTLGAMSTLINGGGLGQLGTIVDEANRAIGGREDKVRHLMDVSNSMLGQLNRRSGDADRLLHAADQLTSTAAADRGLIDEALQVAGPMISVVREQTPRIDPALQELEAATRSFSSLLGSTGDDVKRAVRDVGPVLHGFSQLDKQFSPTLQSMIRLGYILERSIRGNSGASSATLHEIIPQPIAGAKVPDGVTGNEAMRAIGDNFAELFRAVGAPR